MRNRHPSTSARTQLAARLHAYPAAHRGSSRGRGGARGRHLRRFSESRGSDRAARGAGRGLHLRAGVRPGPKQNPQPTRETRAEGAQERAFPHGGLPGDPALDRSGVSLHELRADRPRCPSLLQHLRGPEGRVLRGRSHGGAHHRALSAKGASGHCSHVGDAVQVLVQRGLPDRGGASRCVDPRGAYERPGIACG